jgi:hypothetical protein
LLSSLDGAEAFVAFLRICPFSHHSLPAHIPSSRLKP